LWQCGDNSGGGFGRQLVVVAAVAVVVLAMAEEGCNMEVNADKCQIDTYK
jgi:hypothetical protein